MYLITYLLMQYVLTLCGYLKNVFYILIQIQIVVTKYKNLYLRYIYIQILHLTSLFINWVLFSWPTNKNNEIKNGIYYERTLLLVDVY